jgi:hypothetical protein
MLYAQHLVELQEVIDMKKRNAKAPPEIWRNRLKTFRHDGDAWRQLIEIRSLVLSPDENRESYLKVLSVLRKERRWKLIDVYWGRLFANRLNPHGILCYLKIMWSRGMKPKAVAMMAFFTNILRARQPEEFKSACTSLSPEGLAFVQRIMGFGCEDDAGEFLRAYVANRFSDPQTKARFFRLHAQWKYGLYTSKTSPASSLLDISQLFQDSLADVGSDYRAWAGWAYACSRALSHFLDLRPQFAKNAMSGCLKATQLRPSEAIEFLCQLFSIFFRYGEEIELDAGIRESIRALPASLLVLTIPQIVSHITHPVASVRQAVQDIIKTIGSSHFEVVVFPLNVLLLVNDREKVAIARDMLDSLGQSHPVVFADAKLFIDGLHRSAVTWTEKWLVALDNASRAHFFNDRETVVKLIRAQYSACENPVCEQDHAFLRGYGMHLQRCRVLFDKYEKGDPATVRSMWDNFRSLFNELDDKVKKTESLHLSKICEALANRRDFSMSIPGTYDVDRPSPRLAQIDPVLTVLPTQQHPRCVFMVDTSGIRYKFLLKGNEDIRLDQRIMQLFDLINSLLRANRSTCDLNMSIVKYSIIPFAPNAGLIAWVTGADTFQQLVTDFRARREISPSIELEIAQALVGATFNTLSGLQRYEVYEAVASQTSGDELREMLWLRSPDAASWLERNQNFTVSTALMSIAGYAIGLGDRHPSNIMILRHTGRVIHIDFGDSFEVTMHRTVFAERVPFRLTRMIVNALDGSSVDGLFRRCCEDVLWVIRENQSSIIAQMEVFIHEPIFYGREMRSQVKPKCGILERVAAKLSGKDPNPEEELDAAAQAAILIDRAADARQYVRHYVGWCPFW